MWPIANEWVPFTHYFHFSSVIIFLVVIAIYLPFIIFSPGEYLVIGVSIENFKTDEWNPHRYFRGLLSQENEKDAPYAFRSYLGIVASAPKNFTEFSRGVNHFMEMEPFSYPNPLLGLGHKNIRIEAAYLYDAVMLYANVIRDMLQEYFWFVFSTSESSTIPSPFLRDIEPARNASVSDNRVVLDGTKILEKIRDGREVSRKLRNIRYQSATGHETKMDENGDAEGNFTLVALKNRSNEFGLYPVGFFMRSTAQLPELTLTDTIDWVADGPPVSQPECGFHGEKCESRYQNQTTTTDNKQNIIFGALTSGLVITIVASGLLLRYYKNKLSQYLSNEEVKEFYNGKGDTSEEQTAGDSEYRKFDKKFELTFADVFIDPKDLLGRGNFGTVYKGLVKEEPVAIKRPNDNCSATSFKSVLCEVKLLCYIGTHPNVIQFVGAYTKEIRKGILYIATEFCSNGSLDGLLRKKKQVISNNGDADNETIRTEEEDAVYSHDLHRFAKEIASGMDYIAGMNVIHGDLSARNVLLDENFTCKIGDFGLSRKMYEYLEYVKQSQEPLPWKWMAYESLENMHFTTKSDVWSYGVTLWEIYSLGKVRYGGLSWTTGFADDLKNGLRLQMPEHATEEIYKAMLSCWELDANKRPTFTDMVEFFKELSSSQYIVLEI